MKKRFSAVVVISLAFFFPASINTQWHTNGFLDFPGTVVLETEASTDGLWPQESALQTRDYVAAELSAISLPCASPSGFTFEARFFLNEADAPVTLLALGNSAGSSRAFQLRKEHGHVLVAELMAANTTVAKLSAHKMITAGEWLEVAVVYEQAATDSRRARLYLNGELLTEASPTANWLWPEAATLHLGGVPGSTTFSGKMDEVRLSTLARYRDASYPLAQTHAADEHTIGLWNFEHDVAVPALHEHGHKQANGARLSELAANRHQQESISLEWRTDFERGLEGFVIERRESTADGKFARCGYMPALGNSQRPQHYRFVDTPPKHGVYYYRLAAMNHNGDCGYSNEVACDLF